MRIIEFGRTDKRLKQFIKDHNARQTSLKDQLRLGPVGTAKEVVKLYGAALIKAHGIGQFDPNKLPSLRTNNIQLAKLTEASPRTIQRHVQKLLKSRVITSKVYHGSNADYEIWVNPELLEWSAGAKALFGLSDQKSTILKPQKIGSSVPKCLHTDTGDIDTNSIIAVGNRDRLGKTSIEGSASIHQIIKRSSLSLTDKKSGDPNTGDTGEEARNLAADKEEAGEELSQARPIQKHQAEDGSVSGREASLLFYARLLWSLARNVLYTGKFISPWQDKTALQLIIKLYEPVAPSNMQAVHEMYCERITLVRKYVDRDPSNRFIQLPHRFFDTENATGFVGTRRWGIKHRKRKKEVQLELIYSAQVRKYRKNLNRNDGKQRPPLQVFRECETRLGKLGQPNLVERFYAAVVEPEQFSQISINQ